MRAAGVVSAAVATGFGDKLAFRRAKIRRGTAYRTQRGRVRAMNGTNLVAALDYAARGRQVFPCRSKNNPRVPWRKAATTDAHQINEWWRRRPQDLIGTPTGENDVVLDIDPPAGLDTLEELGFPFWFETPTAHTPRGGLHAHFAIPIENIRNTAGQKGRGIGCNLDWRGLGGYVVLPSPGTGYWWDPIYRMDFPLAEVPDALLPSEPLSRETSSEPIRTTAGLSPYAEAALDRACRAIIGAPDGEQEVTLNGEAFAIGTLAGAGAIPQEFAQRTLIWAAQQIPNHDHCRPWHAAEIERKVTRAFGDGMRHPRNARRA
jgi:hypothetical protein